MIETPQLPIKRICIVANPASGKGGSLKIAQEFQVLSENLGLLTDLIATTSPTVCSQELTQTIGESDAVVVVGGDGSVHLSLQKIVPAGKPFIVIPTGTGNDFARTNNELELDLGKILRKILNETPYAIDIGFTESRGNQKFFGQVLSTGFDSLVNQRANSMKFIKGKIKYTIATLLELPKFKAIDYSITLDEGSIKAKAMLVSVANGPTYGGGMKIIPHASRSDGYLDVMVLAEVSKFELLRVFPKVFSGAHVNHPAVTFYRTKKFSLEAKALAYADGEFIGELPIQGEVLPLIARTWEKR